MFHLLKKDCVDIFVRSDMYDTSCIGDVSRHTLFILVLFHLFSQLNRSLRGRPEVAEEIIQHQRAEIKYDT